MIFDTENARPTKYKEKFYFYIEMMWDGLKFFAYSESHLDRFKGKKFHWTNKFKTKRFLLYNLFAFILILGIIFHSVDKLG